MRFQSSLWCATRVRNSSHDRRSGDVHATSATAASRGSSMLVSASRSRIVSVHTAASTPITASAGTPSMSAVGSHS